MLEPGVMHVLDCQPRWEHVCPKHGHYVLARKLSHCRSCNRRVEAAPLHYFEFLGVLGCFHPAAKHAEPFRKISDVVRGVLLFPAALVLLFAAGVIIGFDRLRKTVTR